MQARTTVGAGENSVRGDAAGRVGLRGNVVDYLLDPQRQAMRAMRPYLVAPDRTWTFGELEQRVGRAANFLKSIGIVPGERVLFSVCDGIDFPTLFLAIMKIGAIALPINTYLKPRDYRYFVTDSQAVVAIVDHGVAAVMQSLRAELPSIRQIVAAGCAVPGLPFLDDEIAAQSADCATVSVDADAMAFWLYSSGSTGNPKGVVHTGAHIYWATELFGIGALGISDQDVILSPPKMYFAFGLGNQVYFPLRAGATVIVNPEPISAQIVWRQWLEHEPTMVMGVPTLFATMLRMAQEDIGRERVAQSCRRLRFCLSGGEVLPEALLQRWRDFADVEILDGVGTTEMTHMFLVNRPGRAVPGSCGQLVDGYRAELVDEDEAPVANGQIGNFRVFGPTAAAEYWNNPDKTTQVMGRGGVLTGDKLYRDQDGNFFLVGRADDMLRVGGIWVSPAEVESAIASHDAVLECAVVGHADPEKMIKPKAFIVLRDASSRDRAGLVDDLRAHVKERLAHFKCPRWFEFVSELPKTSTGKIQRFRLRQPVE
jgi:benzoate-CoA ligase family protein